MRIIAGIYKSRRINPPKGVELRPTADRVKESLFGILTTFIIDKKVLDLFSGTGNLGIEALSRGAGSCVFVDNNPRCIAAIKENLRSLGIQEQTAVAFRDGFRFIKEAHESGRSFDLILLDPPYYKDMIKKSLILMDNYNIITSSGIIIAEHHKADELPGPDKLKNLRQCRQERYGGSFLSFYKPKFCLPR